MTRKLGGAQRGYLGGTRGASGAAALVGLMLMLALTPSAHAGKAVIGFNGGPFPNAGLGGQFLQVRDVAVNEASIDDGHPDADGNVYTVEAGGTSQRVQRFDEDGNFVLMWGKDVIHAGKPGDAGTGFEICTVAADCQFGGTGSGKGELKEASGIAVDQSDGSVLVYDRDNHRIQRFSEDGDFIAMYGDGVNQTDGSDRCTAVSGNACKAGVGGGAAGQLFDSTSANATLRPKLDVIPTGPDAGELVVADPGNQRMVQFDPDAVNPANVFVRAWGWDVVPPGGSGNSGVNEKQIITASGRFGLIFAGSVTQTIATGATPAAVQSALEALPNVNPGDVTVTGPAGGPWTAEFTGQYATTDVPPITGSGGVQTVTVNATGGTFGMTLQTPGGFRNVLDIPFNATASQLAQAIQQELTSIGSGGVTVTGPAGGPWTVEFTGTLAGVDVHLAYFPDSSALTGGASTVTVVPTASAQTSVSGGAFEICTTSCKSGVPTDDSAAASAPNGQFGTLHPNHVAVGADGTVYAGDRNVGWRILRFDSAAATAAAMLKPPLLSTANGGPLLDVSASPKEAYRRTAGVKIDRVTGNLLVVRAPGASGTIIQEIDPATGTEVAASPHGVGAGFESVSGALQGLGVDGSGDRLYVGYSSNGVPGQGFFTLSNAASPAPIVSIGAPTDVEAHAATLHATVTPGGTATYRFQYSRTGADDSWIDVSDPVPVSGAAPIPVSASVTGLEANTFYRVRIVTTKLIDANGNSLTSTSAEQVFLTDAVPPEVSTGAVQHRTASSAQLLGTINPNNLPTNYRFEYGLTTAYGSSVPVPDASAGSGGSATTVMREIANLAPEATYHYRLVATNAEGTAVGVDKAFTTRPAVVSEPPPGRAYEMVTPPDKNNRRAGQVSDTEWPRPGLAAPDGDSLLFDLEVGILDPDAGTAFPNVNDRIVIKRGPSGWTGHTIYNIPASHDSAILATNLIRGLSSDLTTVAAWNKAALFPTGSRLGTRVLGDSGGYLGSGWYDWLGDSGFDPEQTAGTSESAIIADHGERMLRWSDRYRGLLGPSDPSLAQTAGAAVYSQAPPGSGPRLLVNECTGTTGGGNATMIPERDDHGTVFPAGGPSALNDDTIDLRPCEAGTVTSRRGAIAGDGMASDTVAFSNDGARAFFVSPDPTTTVSGALGLGGGGDGQSACVSVAGSTVATGNATECPPQLFVRQLGSGGTPAVGWISRSRSVAQGDNSYSGGMIAGQSIGLLGNPGSGGGVRFEGASLDGRTVYFRTNSPLTPDDRNGTGVAGPIVTGTASANSWDLYRYEMPASADADPTTGTLTRVTGGQGGVDDPNTNGFSTGSSATRFISDDGKRVLFVTKAPMTGADGSPPSGGSTTAAGGVADDTGRNLYLYDSTKSGAQRWSFIARIPYANGSSGVNGCASNDGTPNYPQAFNNLDDTISRINANCVRGTPDGRTVLFETTGKLTDDDTDTASDIYLYDESTDELTRVSAPPAGADAYACDEDSVGTALSRCNADLGFQPPGGLGLVVGGLRHANLAVDGSGEVSVFFESRLPLTSDDANGSQMDVYQWHSGELTLISPGSSDDDAYFSGNSTDGQDVFFYTAQRIDPREIDAADADIYDARVGGGFPLPPPPPPACDVLAGACGNPSSPPPTATSPGSDSLHGKGNVHVVVPARCKRATKQGNQMLRRARGLARKARMAHSRRVKQRLHKQVVRLQRRGGQLRRKGATCTRQAERSAR